MEQKTEFEKKPRTEEKYRDINVNRATLILRLMTDSLE